METVTTKRILKKMQEWASERKPLSPTSWIDACQRMNVLLANDADDLVIKQHEVAKMKNLLLSDKDSKVNKATVAIEATPEYLEVKKLEAHIKRCEEAIRIAKKRAVMADTELKNYS